ncbi:MAG: LysR family transcriptional regulator [Desulfobacteraceae bacterium]|nr:LysR family transcriptional regulator [Desulfobacteraceae bacterium]
MTNLNNLRVFYAVAKLQSFTRAAEELCLTQPGISKHIKQLEEYYETRLFDRLGRKVMLTRAGEILFAATRDIFYLIDEAKIKIDELKGLVGGKLRIGGSFTIATYILPAIMGKFKTKYPGIEINLDISLSREIAGKVLENTLDIGFLGAPVSDERLITKQFLSDELVVVVPLGHEWAERRSVRPCELADKPYIMQKKGSGTRAIVEKKLELEGIVLKKTMEFGNTETVKKAVEAGLGISILSKHVITREVRAGLLKSVFLSETELKRSLYLAYHKDKYITKAAEAFIALCQCKETDFRAESEK